MSNDAGNLNTDFATRTPRVQEPSLHLNTVNLDKLLIPSKSGLPDLRFSSNNYKHR